MPVPKHLNNYFNFAGKHMNMSSIRWQKGIFKRQPSSGRTQSNPFTHPPTIMELENGFLQDELSLKLG